MQDERDRLCGTHSVSVEPVKTQVRVFEAQDLGMGSKASREGSSHREQHYTRQVPDQ